MLKKLLKIEFAFILIAVFVSCNISEKTGVEIKNLTVIGDIEPPVLQEVLSVSSRQVRLVFNEEVTPIEDTFSSCTVQADGYTLLVTLTEDIKPGKQVMLEGRVQDKVGNSSGIKTPVWGFNTNLAGLQINEFSTRGEGNNPDRTELYVTSSGSLAGVVLYNGIPSSWDSMIMLEATDVKSGDFVVVWWTETLPDDVKNTEGVVNVCAKTNINLPGYNGILTLAVSPAQGAEVIDCVVYSNFSVTYEGFGSKQTLERVQKAQKNGWWNLENPIDSTSSTATRTMCRRLNGEGWYVCETKGSSFGKPNNAAEYVN